MPETLGRWGGFNELCWLPLQSKTGQGWRLQVPFWTASKTKRSESSFWHIDCSSLTLFSEAAVFLFTWRCFLNVHKRKVIQLGVGRGKEPQEVATVYTQFSSWASTARSMKGDGVGSRGRWSLCSASVPAAPCEESCGSSLSLGMWQERGALCFRGKSSVNPSAVCLLRFLIK